MTSTDTRADIIALSRGRQWLTLGILGLGVAIGPLDTAVNIAFPAITAAFGIPVPTIQWVVICYVLTYSSLLLGCGRLGDILGHKRVFLWGLWWSAGSLMLCGLAPAFGWFLLFRVFQGIGTALVLSCGPALATLSFQERERGKILGFYTMLMATAMTLGPLIGGFLVEHWGWQAVYLFRVPIALSAAGFVTLMMRRPAAVMPGQRFDTFGALMLTMGLVSLLLALNRGNHTGWLSPSTLGLFGAACVSITLFIRHERRCAEPIIDLSLFNYRAFTIANLSHILISMASFTVFLLVPYFLLTYYRSSVTTGGMLLAVSPLGAMLASPLGGWMLTRSTSSRLSMGGLALATCGLLGVTQWGAEVTIPIIFGALLVQGFGLGLFQVANMDFVMGTIPRHQQGVAGSLTMVTRTVGVVGGATGGALMFGLLKTWYTLKLAGGDIHGADLPSQVFLPAFQGTFWAAAAVAAAACLLRWSGSLGAKDLRHTGFPGATRK
ncbi:MAG: MFS transporter [Pseudomonadota bacterium]